MTRRDINMTAITESAINIGNQDGLDSLTMPKIARSLGIKSQSLYNHVNNLGEIRIAMSISLFKSLKQELLEGMLGLSGRDAINMYFKVFHQFCMDHLHLNRLLFLPAQDQSTELTAAFQDVIQILIRLLKDILPDETTIDLYTKTLMSVFVGFTMNETNNAFKTNPNHQDTNLSEMVDLIFKTVES